MPLPFSGLGRDFKRIKDLSDLPKAVPLISKLPHLFNIFLLPLVVFKLSALNLLPIPQPSFPFLIGSCFPDRDAVELKMLQYGGSGGKNLSCNFTTSEAFHDIFLVEERLVLKRGIT